MVTVATVTPLMSLIINYFLSKIILNVLAWWQFERGFHVIAISDFYHMIMLILGTNQNVKFNVLLIF